MTSESVVLIKGDDPILVNDAVRDVVRAAVGDADPAMVVEELSGDDYTAGAIVDAAQTPAFLADRRVVVARGIGRFSADDLRPVIDYCGAPLDTTVLVLVPDGGRLPAALGKAAGRVIDASRPQRKGDQQTWWAARLRQGPVSLSAGARQTLQEHLGDDLGRAGSILDALASAYGEGATVDTDELLPFLGEAGAVKPWDLTDALDRGDTAAALATLHRLLGAAGVHPLQLLAILANHYGRALRLDGADAGTEAEAGELLGLKGYPAKKALDLSRRLGHDGTVRAIELLALADLDLKGAKDWPEGLVLEVLVARLSRLGRRGRPAAATRKRATAAGRRPS